MDNILTISNLTKSFNQQIVLDNINLEVNHGEFICILGKSGCGKSTLLRLIASFEKAEMGKIEYKKCIKEKPSNDVIMIFQDYDQLFPWLNVYQNISFALKTKFKMEKEKIKAIVMKTLNLVELEGYEEYYPNQLSGGMKQRVAIARALVLHPELILMDEPFSNLDMITKEKLQDVLLNIWNREKNTIIFVTHDINEAIKLADKVVILSKDNKDVKKIIDIDFDRPRKRNNIFNYYYNEIYNLI